MKKSINKNTIRKYNLQYQYLVEAKLFTTWYLCAYEDDILWIGSINRKSKRSNPFIFPTKQLAKKAIKNTIKYLKDNSHPWSKEYRIIPVLLYV